MQKRLLLLFCATALVIAGCKGGNKSGNDTSEEIQSLTTLSETETDDTIDNQEDMNREETKLQEGDDAAAIKVKFPEEPIYAIKTTKGTIKVKLYKETPIHRDNFVKLVNKHFYDDILFHRVINNFMIQVGDPNTKDSTKFDRIGMGGPGYTIPNEISQCVKAGKSHKKGALAAARRGDAVNPDKESSGSQFYIVQSEEGCKHLDGEYTIFGETIEGLDVIDKIASVKTDRNGRPDSDISIISITLVNK